MSAVRRCTFLTLWPAFRFLVIAGLLYSTLLYAQQTDWEREDIRKHRIRKVTMETYLHGTGKPFLVIRATNEYDTRGNLIETIGYNVDDGRPLMRWTYKYDSRNKLIEQDSNGTKYTNTYTYNNKGQLTEVRAFNADGTLREVRKGRLDANGRVVEEISYNTQGRVNGTYKSKFDSAGNLVEFVQLTPDGRQAERKTHSFNAQGNATETRIYGPDDRLTSRTVYRYDGERLREQLEYAADGTLSARYVNKRDAQGFVVERIKYNAQGQIDSLDRSSYEFYP